jgi:Ca2+-binding EF-hand superfamily protein
MVLMAAMTVFALEVGAATFSDGEIDEIFGAFDAQGDGQVSRSEFNFMKIRIIYRNIDTDPIAGVTFEQTKLSRRFFDSLDTDHDGRLSPLEIHDGLRFESVTSDNPGYFTREEFRRFVHSIAD